MSLRSASSTVWPSGTGCSPSAISAMTGWAVFHFHRLTAATLYTPASAADASSAPTPAPSPTAMAITTYMASRVSSSALRKRTRPAMPARLNATARLS